MQERDYCYEGGAGVVGARRGSMGASIVGVPEDLTRRIDAMPSAAMPR